MAEFENLTQLMIDDQRTKLKAWGHGDCAERINAITLECDRRAQRITALGGLLSNTRAELSAVRAEVERLSRDAQRDADVIGCVVPRDAEIDRLRLMVVESHDRAENIISGTDCECDSCIAWRPLEFPAEVQP